MDRFGHVIGYHMRCSEDSRDRQDRGYRSLGLDSLRSGWMFQAIYENLGGGNSLRRSACLGDELTGPPFGTPTLFGRAPGHELIEEAGVDAGRPTLGRSDGCYDIGRQRRLRIQGFTAPKRASGCNA
ncbi:hypothetical protein [Streptomyces sp. Je 1-332]|uniref:hypothetical protein n=1 Tax=Streptomyces sp. Je 1-332 TaxID=3231270 RepID=UPI003457B280